jgi:preprotein translocase subunit SecD
VPARPLDPSTEYAMKKFAWRITICLVPLLIGTLIVVNAFRNYWAGQGGFRIGVDLVGGTILIYEVDVS